MSKKGENMSNVKSHTVLNKKKILGIFVAVLLLGTALSITGCVEENGEEEGENQMVIGMIEEPPEGGHPIEDRNSFAVMISGQIWDPLLVYYPDGEAKGGDRAVAEDYSISDDGLTYTFEIQEGIKFHNGNELNAEDVAFTLRTELGVSEEHYNVENPPEPQRKPDFANIDHIEVTDNYTVQMHMSEVDTEVIKKLGFEQLKIVPKDWIVENGWDNYMEERIGTGPYEFDSYTEGSELVLKKFDDYRLDLENEGITFSFYDNLDSAVVSLRSGDVQYIPSVKPEIYHDVEDTEGVDRGTYPLGGNWYVAFNQLEGMTFENKSLRKAFAYAVDKEEVINAVRGPELVSNTRSPIPPDHPAHNSSLNPYERDLEKAEEYLAEAGYEDGLETEMYIKSGTESEATVIKEQVAEIGIDVEITSLDWGEFVETLENGEPPLAFTGYFGAASPYTMLNYYETEEYTDAGEWSLFYRGEDFTELVENATKTPDPDERNKLYKDAIGIMVDRDMGLLNLYTEKQPSVYDADVDIPESSWQPYNGGPIFLAYSWEY